MLVGGLTALTSHAPHDGSSAGAQCAPKFLLVHMEVSPAHALCCGLTMSQPIAKPSQKTGMLIKLQYVWTQQPQSSC